MSIAKHYHQTKSGLFFVIFIIIIAVFLVLYFSGYNKWKDDSNLNANVNNQNSEINANNNVNLAKNSNKNSNFSNKNINSNTNISLNSNINSVAPETVIKSGFTIINPDEVTTSDTGDITNYNFGNQNTLNVMPDSYEGIVKNSVGITKEEVFEVAGVTGVKYTGSSAKDGTETVFIIVKKGGNLYHFQGNSDFFNNLADYIKFNN